MKVSFTDKFIAMLVVAVCFLPYGAQAWADESPKPIPAFAKGTCVLFQGDSITDGNRGRSPDPNHILGHGYVFIIAAKYGAAFPELDLDFVNRGVSGNTVLDLEKRWQNDTLDVKPDVLSVLIGVNDNGRGMPLDQYEQLYDKLLAEVRAANPDVKLVLCEPFGLPVGRKKSNWEVWFDGIRKRQQIVAKLAQKHHAALVQFQLAFDDAVRRAPAEHWIWDGVHPTYSGHQIMADEWVRTVARFWPAEEGQARASR
jgi:lysophospholipase L1-like esterase